MPERKPGFGEKLGDLLFQTRNSQDPWWGPVSGALQGAPRFLVDALRGSEFAVDPRYDLLYSYQDLEGNPLEKPTGAENAQTFGNYVRLAKEFEDPNLQFRKDEIVLPHEAIHKSQSQRVGYPLNLLLTGPMDYLWEYGHGPAESDAFLNQNWRADQPPAENIGLINRGQASLGNLIGGGSRFIQDVMGQGTDLLQKMLQRKEQTEQTTPSPITGVRG